MPGPVVDTGGVTFETPDPQAPSPLSGEQPFGLVEAYHDFGIHRTGTAADLATADWFFGHLTSMGATVDRREVVFDRYDVKSRLVDATGADIACDAVFYEFLGRYEGGGFDVLAATQRGSGSAAGWDDVLLQRDRPSVIVTDGPPGQIVMPNRAIGDCVRPPAVVVAPDAADRLDGAQLMVDAQLVPGICEASSARLGSGPSITITTPLSGWWGCWSERGTGIAVALDLAARLAVDFEVTVVACSGHELDHVGLHTWLDDAAAQSAIPPGPVIHLGASIAAANNGQLEPRMVLHDPGESPQRLAQLAQRAEPAMFSHVGVDDPWPGEGRNWRHYTTEVLSFTGRGRWFHTPSDTPALATSPAALEQARDAVWDAVGWFVR